VASERCLVSDELGGTASEAESLTGFLDWYRSVAIRKVEDLALADAIAVATPSGLSPLGIVKHLAAVERLWFRWRFAGEDVEVADSETTFGIDAGDTVDAIVASYRDECERSRSVVAAAPSLDASSARPSPFYGTVSLRWTLVHLIEETARHTGHLDIIRERIDGRTGD
jgi:uncharacterized damage-inducible protein DinB